MFRQEINLYHAFEEPAPPTGFLSWRQMQLLNLFFIIVLTIIVIYSFFIAHLLERKKIQLLAKASELQNQFFISKKQYPDVFFEHDATQSIEKLTQEMQLREKILQKVINYKLFSEYLIALSKTILPDVWITSIHITNGGDEISLKGKSLSSDKMQLFLTRLTSDKTFLNYSLSVKNIEDNSKSKDKGDLIFDITMVKSS